VCVDRCRDTELVIEISMENAIQINTMIWPVLKATIKYFIVKHQHVLGTTG